MRQDTRTPSKSLRSQQDALQAICGFLLSEWVAPGSLEDPDFGPHEYTSACIFPPGHEGGHSWA